MLPDGPNTSESQMSLPTLSLAQQQRLVLSAPTNPATKTHNLNDTKQTIMENIFPGIYFSNFIDYWSAERLRAHGFTHLVYIDRHLQRKLTGSSHAAACCLDASSMTTISQANVAGGAPMIMNNNHELYLNKTQKAANGSGGSSGNDLCTSFDILDLNFGEETFLMTVLPNCYKAVKFIDKALISGGAILVIDPLSEQKCLTIVTGYLMYKHNITFSNAYQRIKSIFKTAELEPFFIRQLYEYEPILQVERAQLRGQSCSRELRSAQLKRKILHDDLIRGENDWNCNGQPLLESTTSGSHNVHYQSFSDNNNSDVIME